MLLIAVLSVAVAQASPPSQSPLTGPPASGPAPYVQVLDASFASPAVPHEHRVVRPVGSPWRFAGAAGIVRWSAATPAVTGGPSVGGSRTQGGQVAWLGGGDATTEAGGLSQVVDFAMAGHYQLRFLGARTGGVGALRITINGAVVGRDVVPNAARGALLPDLEPLWTAPFFIAAPGSYDLHISAVAGIGGPRADELAVNAAGDAIIIDQVLVASVPAALTRDGGFDDSGWSLSGAARIVGSELADGEPRDVLRLRAPGDQTAGFAIHDVASVAAGIYSVSARLARGSDAIVCETRFGHIQGSDFVPLASLTVAASGGRFEAVTSRSFDLPAGDYRFALSEDCPDAQAFNLLDAPSLNFAAREPQFDGQAIIGAVLDPGVYVLQVNALQGATDPPPFTRMQLRTAAESGEAEQHVQWDGATSDPLYVATPSMLAHASITRNYGSANSDVVRVVQLGSLPLPAPVTVSLTLEVDGVQAGPTAWAGATLRATARAASPAGLQRLRILRNGVALVPESTATAPASAASPLQVTVTSLLAGEHRYSAEATDHRGVVRSAEQSLQVLATAALRNGGFETPSQADNAAGHAYNPSGADWTFAGMSAIQRNGSTLTAPAAPEGVQTAALRCAPGMTAGSIAQDAGFARAGAFRLSLQWATRSSPGAAPAQPVRLRVGGVDLALFADAASAQFVRFTSTAIKVDAGTVRVELAATQCDADRTTFIDDVKIEIIDTPPVIGPIATVTPPVAGNPALIRVPIADAGSGVAAVSISAQLLAGGAIHNQICGTVTQCDLTIATAVAGLYRVQVVATDTLGVTSSAVNLIAVSELPDAPELPLPGTVAIGTSAGQFAVSANGAATYSMPITVAPGVNGLQPALALSYNSQGGDGHAGLGWSLSGLSAITRCPRTLATDGIREPINYDDVTDPVTGNDAFCIDGQRLVPMAGGLSSVSCTWPPEGGVASSCRAWEFRTEIDNYSRVIGIGDNAVNGSAGSGPTRFRVYSKSGQILEFGSRWWGIGAPRPDPRINVIADASFEGTRVTDLATNPNIALGLSFGLPQSWGYFLMNAQANGLGWLFDGGTDPAYSATSSAGIQLDGSAWSTGGPYSTSAGIGAQNAFVQRRGRFYTSMWLEAGNYTLSFRLAGRSAGPGYGGAQTLQIVADGVVQATASSTSGQAFAARTVNVSLASSGWHTLIFAGTRNDDQTAFVDDIRLTPLNRDIYSIKLFPLDRIEDRNGNYLHIDYGGTHEAQYLRNADGSLSAVNGTVQSSYGNARVPALLPATVATLRSAQGARPALEMYPRRLTWGMRTATPGDGHNQASVGGIEVARVILNYEDRDDLSAHYDSGAGQMRLSKRLASIWSLVGGSDDSSLAADRNNFHLNEIAGAAVYGAQCLTGGEATCGTLVRRYVLGYGTSAGSQRSRLERVEECAGDGQCLPATTFAWQDDTTLQLAAAGSGSQLAGDGADWNGLLKNGRVADVVGDGRSRVVVRAGNAAFRVCEHTGSKFTCALWPVSLPAGVAALPDGQSGSELLFADFSGDGIADLLVFGNNTAYACPAVWKTSGSVDTTRALANSLGTCVSLPDPFPAAAANTALAQLHYPPGVGVQARIYGKAADVDGDGRMDVLFYRGDGRFEVCRAKGGRADIDPQWSCLNPGYVQVANLAYTAAGRDQEIANTVIADFNGDGRADLALRIAPVCVDGSGYHEVNGASVANGTWPGTPCLRVADSSSKYWVICFASGSLDAMPDSGQFFAFNCASRGAAGVGGAVAAVDGSIDKFSLYDFNGDGLADFGKWVPGAGWRICLSTGDGEFADRGADGECPVWPGPTAAADRTVAGDFNGDGRTDLASFKGGTTWQVCLSTGRGFSCRDVVTSLPNPANCGGYCFEALAGDFDGNGKTDLIVNAAGTGGTLHYGMNGRVLPDLLHTITTGLGAQTQIVYRPLTDATVYQKERPNDGNFAALGQDELAIQSPLQVVAQVRASTGNSSGRWLQSEYFYAQLVANKWGRGAYGFRGRSLTENLLANADGGDRDDRAAVVTGSLASQRWPNVGRPDKLTRVARRDSGVYATISTTDFTYASRARSAATLPDGASVRDGIDGLNYGNYRVYEGFQVLALHTVNDLDGSPMPTMAVHTGVDPQTRAVDLAAYFDTYGNPLSAVTISTLPGTGERWQQRVDNEYFSAGADGTRWLLGLLKRSTTTTVQSGLAVNPAGSTVRTSAFTYQGYGGSCTGAVVGQLCSETIEPDAADGTVAPYTDRSLFQRTSYAYDAFGNRELTTVSFYGSPSGAGGLQSRTSRSAYLAGKYLLSVDRLDGSGEPVLTDSRAYPDPRCRMPGKLTDGNGNYATMEYDAFCRKVRETAWTHDGRRIKQSTLQLGTLGIVPGRESYALTTAVSDGSVAAQYFDQLQRVVRGQTKTFDGSMSATSTTYDELGRIVAVVRPVSAADSSAMATTRFEYDSAARPVREVLPDGDTVRTEYAGTVIRQIRSNTGGTANGSALPHLSIKTSGVRGAVTTVETGYRQLAEAPSTQTILTTLRSGYDALGNQTSVEAPGAAGSVAVRTMRFDLRGRQVALNDSDSGAWTYQYNGLGELVRQTDARGFVTATQYDVIGRQRLRSETQPNAADAITTWNYDCGDGSSSRGKGLLCGVTYSGTADTANRTERRIEYDRYARAAALVVGITGRSFRSQTAYDRNGRSIYAVYPQAAALALPLAIATRYRDGGFIDQVSNAETGFAYQTVVSRNNDGLVNATRLAGGLLSQVTGYGTDAMGRIAAARVTGADGSLLLDRQYAFDSIGNLIARSSSSPAVTNESFAYDSLDRLVANTGGGTGAAYAYDRAGNLVSKSGVDMSYTDGSNRLCGVGVATLCASANSGANAVEHDRNGNVLRYRRPDTAATSESDGRTITLSGYTAFNLPTRVVSTATDGAPVAAAEFHYDAAYQRIRQLRFDSQLAQVDDILYVVPGAFEVHLNGGGQITRSVATVAGIDGAIASVVTPFDVATGRPLGLVADTRELSTVSGTVSTTRMLLQDHLHSTIAEAVILDSATAPRLGSVTHHAYGPWGSPQPGSLPASSDQRGFTSHEHLSELGLIHMNGRLFDPALGRFLQADPLIQAPYNAQSHNRYAYVCDNPLSFTDPSGFSAWTRFRDSWLKPSAAIVAAVLVPELAAYVMETYASMGSGLLLASESISTVTLSAAGNAVAAMAGGFAAGGIAGGNVQSALQGALTAGLTSGLASELELHGLAMFGEAQHAGQIALHSAMGCAQASLAGGSCRSGAVAGLSTAFVSPGLGEQTVTKLVEQAALGGIAAKLSGGKFANGALSAAFSYLFNEGVDRIVARAKREVMAVDSGVVIRMGWENPDNPRQGFGFSIQILSTDGETLWRYAHMEPATRLFEGMLVLEGDVIGRYSVTISGNSTGPHLHLEARDRNNRVYTDQGDVQPISGGRMTSGIQANRTVRTNNGWQSRPHNGSDWVGPP